MAQEGKFSWWKLPWRGEKRTGLGPSAREAAIPVSDAAPEPSGAYGRGAAIDGRMSWWRDTLEGNCKRLGASLQGLSSQDAARRLAMFGHNRFTDTPAPSIVAEIGRRFLQPLVLLLLAAALISAAVGDAISAAIIMLMVLLGVLLGFTQEYRAGQAAQKLKLSVAVRTVVRRDGNPVPIDVECVVPGDIVILSAGQLVPADGRLVSASDLFVTQAALTGEAYPVEKRPDAVVSSDELQDAGNALFMGTSVVSGQAAMLVCATGLHTRIGHVSRALSEKRNDTAFERSISQFGRMIFGVTMALVLFVLAANFLAHKPLLQSFLFALALAVGLTPELLPAIVTVTLTRGALRLARKHVIVKRLAAIQDLGSVDILCTDKTGTLTEGSIRLERHLDIQGRESEAVLRYAWLNCFFESGTRTPLEDAILAHEPVPHDGWRKIDEVPFDFERRRLSVLLAQRTEQGESRLLVLKGAPEDVLAHCTAVAAATDGAGHPALPLDQPALEAVRARLASLEEEGFRTLAVAIRDMPPNRDHASLGDEDELILLGILAFLDPPKKSAAGAVRRLSGYGVKVKILTGDSDVVTRYVCGALGIPVAGVLTGSRIAQLDDAALRTEVEAADLFCRVNPMQKNRVILALKANGHVVGYLGDGINDAPALHNADVGISVDKAVDVAREAADLILLRQNLAVLAAGVAEGRRTFANVRKYIMMGTSSNFGNMISMAAAALFLPFLPMQPVQILLNNILYDLSQAAIPLDAVDRKEILAPQQWDIRSLRNFMLVMGPVSSLFDFLTFYLLLAVFHADRQLFQTGWFIESLTTQVLVIFVIRTTGNTFLGRPHPLLVISSLFIVGLALAIPHTAVGVFFGFVPLPSWFFVMLGLLTLAYLALAQCVKMLFYSVNRKRPA